MLVRGWYYSAIPHTRTLVLTKLVVKMSSKHMYTAPAQMTNQDPVYKFIYRIL
eukprot:COSAG02_NODE_70344_length_196_cov_51.051546_1_plen_52_part_10